MTSDEFTVLEIHQSDFGWFVIRVRWHWSNWCLRMVSEKMYMRYDSQWFTCMDIGVVNGNGGTYFPTKELAESALSGRIVCTDPPSVDDLLKQWPEGVSVREVFAKMANEQAQKRQLPCTDVTS